MPKLPLKLITLLVGLILSFGFLGHSSSLIQNNTINVLNHIKSIYELTYAPAEWKGEFSDWDLNAQYEVAMGRIQSKGNNIDILEGRDIILDFINSMRDYHVSVSFNSTEAATLPLIIRGAEDRYFIVYIDRSKLSESLFPFNVGDEVVSFDGRPTSEVVAELRDRRVINTAETDQALAELTLTRRRASAGLEVPQGPISIGVQKKDSSVTEYRQIIWDYSPEEIPLFSHLSADEFSRPGAEHPLIPTPQMLVDIPELEELSPHGMGQKNSFLPSLGKVIWEADSDSTFQAYIYVNEKGQTIGVVRIPAYTRPGGNDVYNEAVENFSEIINRMEKLTDALVIDQLNNPGGSVFYLYALASTLSTQPLQAPRHIMSVTPQQIQSCVNSNKTLEGVKTDSEARSVLGDYIHGYPVSIQFVQFYRSYCEVYKEDWKKGNTLTRPFWIAGVDQINPYPKGTYSKPIMVLINELDFSGGDFFPTILQDNERATIFGTRTAGAGGYVRGYSFPNLLGIQGFRVTESLAQRVNDNPIENLGVTPDIQYTMSAKDLQNNYSEYIKAVNQAVKGLLE